MDVTLFFGKTNPEFSNYYVRPFEVGGHFYNSVEHYFMMMKALLFDYNGDEARLMTIDKPPSQLKKLGRKVKNFDPVTWNSHCKRFMYTGVLEKFKQNKDLAEKLLDTQYNVLAEASPFDKKWGIGVGVSTQGAENPENWKGSNWLGLILMAVRNDLRQGGLDYNDHDLIDNHSTINYFHGLDFSLFIKDRVSAESNGVIEFFDNYQSVEIGYQALGEISIITL